MISPAYRPILLGSNSYQIRVAISTLKIFLLLGTYAIQVIQLCTYKGYALVLLWGYFPL